MNSFQFKIKGYLNETGEYTEFFSAEPGTILQLIIQHWFNENLPNNLDVVVLRNQQGDLFIIDHLKRDIFDYYLIPAAKKKKYFHAKTDIQLMFFLLESFFSDRLDDMSANMKLKDDDEKFVRGDLSGKTFLYKVTGKRLWSNLSWLAYLLFTIVSLSMAGMAVHPAILIIVLLFAILTIGTNYQRIIMYRQYYLDNKELEVSISRGSELIQVKTKGGQCSIPKTDIRKITRFISPPDDAHLQAEYYLEIEFLNGNILNLTSLLISQVDADGKFMHNLIPFEVEVAKNGFLKRSTDLTNYLSAIRVN